MEELKNCENCKHRKIRKSRGYPCMCCELLNPISFNSKWEEEPLVVSPPKAKTIRLAKNWTDFIEPLEEGK